MANSLIAKRGTRSQVTAAASANALVPYELIYVTDEQVVEQAVGNNATRTLRRVKTGDIISSKVNPGSDWIAMNDGIYSKTILPTISLRFSNNPVPDATGDSNSFLLGADIGAGKVIACRYAAAIKQWLVVTDTGAVYVSSQVTGPWVLATTLPLPTTSAGTTVTGPTKPITIVYANGIWALTLAANDVSLNGVYVASNPFDGFFKLTNTIISDANQSPNFIGFENGYWVVCGHRRTGTATSYNIAYTKLLLGTWTNVAVATSAAISSVKHNGANWVLANANGGIWTQATAGVPSSFTSRTSSFAAGDKITDLILAVTANVWVACTDTGKLSTGIAAGTTWTSRLTQTSSKFMALATDGTICLVAVARTDTTASSIFRAATPTGTWSAISTSFTGSGLGFYCLEYASSLGHWLAGSNRGTGQVMYAAGFSYNTALNFLLPNPRLFDNETTYMKL